MARTINPEKDQARLLEIREMIDNAHKNGRIAPVSCELGREDWDLIREAVDQLAALLEL